LVANSCLLEVRETKHTGDLREQACRAKCRQEYKMDEDAAPITEENKTEGANHTRISNQDDKNWWNSIRWLGLVQLQIFLQNDPVARFVVIRQLVSNHGLIRLKRFVSSISSKLCN
jgi:hypothetical protein